MAVEHEGRQGLELVNLKAKTAVQADAWRKCIGKDVTTPVNFVSNKNPKGSPHPWIEAGQLPTLARPVTVAA